MSLGAEVKLWTRNYQRFTGLGWVPIDLRGRFSGRKAAFGLLVPGGAFDFTPVPWRTGIRWGSLPWPLEKPG